LGSFSLPSDFVSSDATEETVHPYCYAICSYSNRKDKIPRWLQLIVNIKELTRGRRKQTLHYTSGWKTVFIFVRWSVCSSPTQSSQMASGIPWGWTYHLTILAYLGSYPVVFTMILSFSWGKRYRMLLMKVSIQHMIPITKLLI